MNDYYELICKWGFLWSRLRGYYPVKTVFAHLPDFIKVEASDRVAFYINDYEVFNSVDGFNDGLSERNKLRIAKIIDKAMRDYVDAAALRIAARSDKLNSTIDAALGDKLPPSH